MRWSEYAQVYLSYCTTHKRLRTVRNFDKPALESFTYHGELQDISGKDILEWAATLKAKGYRSTTIAMRWGCLSAAFGRAVKMGLLTKSPFLGLSAPPRATPGRCLTDQEVFLILSEAPPLLHRIATFALNTGCRISEIKELRWEHVRDWIIYMPSDRRKNRKGLRMPVNSAARAAMGTPSTGPVFAISERTVQGQLLKLSKRLSLGRIRFHDLRHTFITNYLRHGREKDLIEMGTHSSRNGLSGYNHPPEELLRSRMERVAKEEGPAAKPSSYWSSSTILPR